MSVRKSLTWQPHSTLVFFVLFHFILNSFEHLCDSHDRCLGWKCIPVRRPWKKNLSTVGNSSFSWRYVMVLLSSPIPVPGVCLETYGQGILEHMEEGRKSKGEGGNSEEHSSVSGCGPIVFRVTQLFLSAPQQDCSLPSGCMSKTNTTPCPH